jgi:Kef-type K+ transport system membrane component KefB
MIALTVLICLTSAWFTGIIGVHPIFGGKCLTILFPSHSPWVNLANSFYGWFNMPP